MEYGSKKYIILLALICVVFIFFIVKAFDYLPDKSVERQYRGINNQIQSNLINNNNNNVTEMTKNDDPVRHKSGHIDFMPNVSQEENRRNEYEEIKAPNGTFEDDIQPNNNARNETISPEDKALKAIVNAAKLKTDLNYTEALEELHKVPELTTDKELVALSYEKTAEIYAAQKRFGTALSFAGKAYSTSPNANREMLVARIYYQSGDTENAVSRMNNILSRGFKD